jgi:hypothetical protein
VLLLGLVVGHLPLESGCDPSGHVCVVVTAGALTMFTGGGDEPVLFLNDVGPGHSLPGIHVSLPLGSPGSQGRQV